MNPEVLAAARRIVHRVVEEIFMASTGKGSSSGFSGVRDRRRRSFISHWRETLISKYSARQPATLAAPATRQVVYHRIPALTAALNAIANNGNWSYWLIKSDRWLIR